MLRKKKFEKPFKNLFQQAVASVSNIQASFELIYSPLLIELTIFHNFSDIILLKVR